MFHQQSTKDKVKWFDHEMSSRKVPFVDYISHLCYCKILSVTKVNSFFSYSQQISTYLVIFLQYFPEGSRHLFVSQAVDEGIEHGSEDGVEDRDHFVLTSSVIGFGEKDRMMAVPQKRITTTIWEEQVDKAFIPMFNSNFKTVERICPYEAMMADIERGEI